VLILHTIVPGELSRKRIDGVLLFDSYKIVNFRISSYSNRQNDSITTDLPSLLAETVYVNAGQIDLPAGLVLSTLSHIFYAGRRFQRRFERELRKGAERCEKRSPFGLLLLRESK